MSLLLENTQILFSYPEPLPQAYRMTTAGLEKTIACYAGMRASMHPPVPQDWSMGVGQAVVAKRNPAWGVECDQLAGDPLLHIRHEGFGWLHFIIDRADAQKIGEALIAIANTPAPKTAGRA